MIETLIKKLVTQTGVTRNYIQELAVKLSEKHSHILFNHTTRLGKNLTVLKIVKHHKFKKVLFVNQQDIHIANFKKDAADWNHTVDEFTCICWNSYHKADNDYDCVIIDEADTCIDQHIRFLTNITCNVYLLTGTIHINDVEIYMKLMPNLFWWQITLEQAMNWGILPKPEIYLKEVILNQSELNEITEIEKELTYWKEKANEKGWCKIVNNKSVPTWEAIQANQRGLARKKVYETAKIRVFEEINLFQRLKDKRTIFFLPSIKDSKQLGNAVSSLETKKENNKTLDKFNKGEINYIISKKILIRGVNVYDCKYGVFLNIDLGDKSNSLSQAFARVLLGVSPVCIMFYCKSTKEEKIIQQFIQFKKLNYNML